MEKVIGVMKYQTSDPMYYSITRILDPLARSTMAQHLGKGVCCTGIYIFVSFLYHDPTVLPKSIVVFEHQYNGIYNLSRWKTFCGSIPLSPCQKLNRKNIHV